MKIIVTGGYGFIGSCLIKKLIQESHEILNIDLKTYASMPESLNENKKIKILKILQQILVILKKLILFSKNLSLMQFFI